MGGTKAASKAKRGSLGTYTREGANYDALNCISDRNKGKRITIFINGDIISHGIQITLPKYMTKWELLIRDICNATGQFITTIYTAQGKKLSRIEQIEHGYIYVAAGHEPFKLLSYSEGTNVGDRSCHDIHKSGFRKNEHGFKERMERLWYASKAIEIQVWTMNELTAATQFVLGVKDLLSFTQFCRRVSLRVALPHGNGAVKHLYDVDGNEITDCNQLEDRGWYLAIGGFKGPKMKHKHVLGRARQLNTVFQIESVKPRKRDLKPKRPPQLPGLSPQTSPEPQPHPSPPRQHQPTRTSRITELHSPVPGPAQAPTKQRSGSFSGPQAHPQAQAQPTRVNPNSPLPSIATNDARNSVAPEQQANAPFKPFAGDVAGRIADMLSFKEVVVDLQTPLRQRQLWDHLEMKTNVETPVGMLIPLLRDQFPMLGDKPYIMTRAYSSVTSRKPSSKAVIYRTELSAIVTKLYVYRLVLTAYSPNYRDKFTDRLCDEAVVDRDQFTRGVASLGLGTAATPSSADAAWDSVANRDAAGQPVAAGSANQGAGGSLASLASLGAVCDWVCEAVCPQGTKVNLDSFAHGALKSEMTRLASSATQLILDQARLADFWGGPNVEERPLSSVVEQLRTVVPDMHNTMLSHRAYNQLKFPEAPSTPGMLTSELLPAFVALMCYFHALVFAFPIVGSMAGVRLGFDQFSHMAKCLLLSATGHELHAIFETMETHHDAEDTVDFDEIVAWYTSFNFSGSTVAPYIRGGHKTDEAPKVDPIHLEEVRSLSKSLAKNKVKAFEAVEKQLDSDVSSAAARKRFFAAVDTNENSIVAMDEISLYFSKNNSHLLPTQSHKAAVVRALKIATGKEASLGSDGNFEGQAWCSRSEFCQVMCLSLYWQKIFVLLLLTDEEQTGNPLNITFEKFRAIAKILKVKLNAKSAGTEYLSVKALTAQSGQQTGRGRGAVTLDDVCLWYARTMCPNAFVALETEGAMQGGGSKAKKKRQTAQGLTQDAAQKRLVQLSALEDRMRGLAGNVPEVDKLWNSMHVHANDTVPLAAYTKFLTSKFALLDRPVAIDAAFLSTTGRAARESETVERREFLALLVHTFYFHDIDCRFIAKHGQSRLENSAIRLKIFEAREFLAGCGFRMSDAQLHKEFQDMFTENYTDGAADGFSFAHVCLWFAKQRCPAGVGVVPSTPFDETELGLQTAIFEATLLAELTTGGPATVATIDAYLRATYPSHRWRARAGQEALKRGAVKSGTVGALPEGFIGECSGDCTVPDESLQMYMLMLLYFNEMFDMFGVGFADESPRLTFLDFKAATRKFGLTLDEAALAENFVVLSKKAQDTTGVASLVLCEDACELIVRHKLKTTTFPYTH